MTKRRNLKQKTPKVGKRIKQPSIGDVTSPDSHPPIFSFRYLDTQKYSIDNCEKEEKVAFVDKICKLGKIPWQQLRQAGRHGMGYEKIDRTSLRVGIPPHITEEVNFIAFRFYTKAPMVGYRDRAIFHVLWVDRDFSLYSH